MALPAAAVEPVVQVDDDGSIDWTCGCLRVLGVATPRILSPSGGLTDGDPYAMAVDDARKRLGRLLERVRIDADRRLGRLPTLAQRRGRALDTLRSEGPLRFADGTVHLPAELDLSWLPEALGEPLGPEDLQAFVGPPLPAEVLAASDLPTGLILEVAGPLSPSTRLRLEGEPPRAIGWAGDAAGHQGLRWFRGGDPGLAAHVGRRPVRLAVEPLGVGRIALSAGADPGALAQVAHLPAAVVLK